ncbi:MAG: hypothetical protein K6U75_11410 [Firmicutes bacterium]|nr:hypothetical protein [Bacillota bacterium]
MQKSVRQRVVLVALLGVLVLLGVFLYRQLHVGWFLFALRHDYPPKTFVTVRSLLHKAERGYPLSAEEFEMVSGYAEHWHPGIRVRVLTTFFYLADEEHAERARQIAMERLRDRDWLVRVYALRSLYHLRHPEIYRIAQQRVADPQEHERVREWAQRILSVSER